MCAKNIEIILNIENVQKMYIYWKKNFETNTIRYWIRAKRKNTELFLVTTKKPIVKQATNKCNENIENNIYWDTEENLQKSILIIYLKKYVLYNWESNKLKNIYV